ncbi:MAG: SprT family zinc-dependent metalloprotease [Candidatus Falkowbacteria bacterium]|nr:SprT family zinc-dependent metalloprotease [Candidatus Falkowbacteria bacterium]
MKSDFSYIIKTVRRSRRLRLAVHHDGRVVITKPYFLSKAAAEAFLRSKTEWVKAKLEHFKNMPAPLVRPHNRQDYLKHKEEARALVISRLEYFNRFYNFKYQRISIRDQKTRWGSCSRTGNLNFSYRLLELTPAAADYIIVHELCHLREMNHSVRFWGLVSKTVPDYERLRRELRGRIV